MKILCVLGTRPEVIKMAPVVCALERRSEKTSVHVCVTAQHRQMLDQMMEVFRIRADIDLDLMEPKQTLAGLSARVIERMTSVLQAESPDWVLVQGDTATVMATALAAFYERIPVGHVEAGLRTKDPYNPFPEEINRRLTSVLATYHFAPTYVAEQNLLREGIRADRIFTTGNTIVDALCSVLELPFSDSARQVLTECLGEYKPSGASTRIAPNRKLVLVTAHRRESFGRPLEAICHALRSIADEHENAVVVYPVHMNPKVREPVSRLLSGHQRIRLIEPLAYEPFLRLLDRCDLVLTDSGGIQEEASVLGKPVLVLRDVTERTEIIDAGIGKLVGTDARAISAESKRFLAQDGGFTAKHSSKLLYGDGRAAERIAGILLDGRYSAMDGVEKQV